MALIGGVVEMVQLNTEIDTRNLERVIKIAPRVLKFELADGMDRIGKGFLKRFRQQQLQGTGCSWGIRSRSFWDIQAGVFSFAND